MSRKTVPILMGSIAILLVALVAIIVILLSAPEHREANARRRGAVNTLLSSSLSGLAEDRQSNNLATIAAGSSSPIAIGGSLDNLQHFLGKDPGRSVFPRSGDRKRAAKYLEGNDGSHPVALVEGDIPSWVPSYINSVSYLFNSVKDDMFAITGYPEELTFLEVSGIRPDSSLVKTEMALSAFFLDWIPAGENRSTYSPNKEIVRAWLMSSRRFKKRLTGIDDSWKELVATLYNLSVDSRWHTAVGYAPQLGRELDELILVVLSADIYRRSRDVLEGFVEEGVQLTAPGPGIIWTPEMSYYKNIPELTGYTSDNPPYIYFAKVSIAYTFRDGRTQTWLNRRKDWLSDYFGSFFSSSVKADFSPEVSNDWKASRLKAEAIHGINEKIVAVQPFGVKKAYGVRELAFVRVNLLANP